MSPGPDIATVLPPALSFYSDGTGEPLLRVLLARIQAEPFNAVASALFAVAILHTFAAIPITNFAGRVQQRHDARARGRGVAAAPSVLAEWIYLLGEVEAVFGLWAIVLLVSMSAYAGWESAAHYFNDIVSYTEPLFVVVIMALASTRPIVVFAEAALKRVADLGQGSPAAWWLAILTIGPLLGSFITEPGAMTICAMLLARQFYDLEPSPRLKYATLGLLFVNVSIGGTMTHFAAPPVLMVARPWGWDLATMFWTFGWRAAAAIAMSTLVYFLVFRREFARLGARPASPDVFEPESAEVAAGSMLRVPAWLTVAHVGFMAWTVLTAHYPALFVGGFLVFLGFAKATAVYQSRIELKPALMVGFFLGGLVIHGGLQAWWIAPVIGRLSALPLFVASTFLTSFNDNAMITYLATLVPNLSEPLKEAVLQGAVTGGGLTVIANAPNPAGQALLSRFFNGGVSPLRLFLGAAVPTAVAALAFRLF